MNMAEIRRQNLRELLGSYSTQQELADAIGISVQYLNQLLTGHRNIGEKTARKIEAAAKIPSLALDVELKVGELSNVSPGPPIRGMVPLISWVSAGRWRDCDVQDEPLAWIPVTFATPNVFALRVEGDSMKPDYPPGHILFVDPDRHPEPMNLVIALNGDGEATFKRLTREGGVWYLMPLNERYPPQKLDSLCKIIGVVIWTGKPEV
jgi:SOS-response transcriptional repressor LexA